MKIAIVGYGQQGQSSLQYWSEAGNEVVVHDMNAELTVPAGIATVLGEHYLQGLDSYDLIVRSPLVHPRDIVAANGSDILKKVTSNTNEFLRVCPTRNVIGVTGTKGKGTTSALITRMLAAAGKTVHLGGNIGTAPLDLLKGDDYLTDNRGHRVEADNWVVLELANFQLIDLKYSPMIAVCLMVVPEHLNWHVDMAEYVAAKAQLFVWQTPDDIAIYYADNENSVTVSEAGNGAKLPYMAAPGARVIDGKIVIGPDDAYQEICRVEELKLLGEHNWQNACAAVTAVWQVSHNIAAIRQVLTTFTGLPHRLEFVRELDGVQYYNDSFGTTPETAMVAMQAFEQPKVVILGGSDKGADYTALAQTVASSNVRKVLLIGDQAERIRAALDQASYADYAPGGTTMTEIVTNARQSAQAGDIVLLSTGCASFDMFMNYQDRGQQFEAAVRALV